MSWDAVDDFFVDAGARGGRKGGPATVLMRIVFEERLGVAEAKVLRDYRVDLGRGHAGDHYLAHELMRLPDTNAGLAHQGDFTFRFKLNHVELRSYGGLHSPAILAGWRPCFDPGQSGRLAAARWADYVVQLR